MRWQSGRRSTNIDDRRGRSTAARVGGAGSIVVVVICLIMVAMGEDPSALLSAANSGQSTQQSTTPSSPLEDERADFVSVILADTEDTWGRIFAERGQRYPAPRLVLFRGSVESACGFTSAAVGPFYCPGDHQVYIDLGFFDELDQRFGAPGDFAQAYVVAHEVGHHLQSVLGTSAQVQAQRRRVSEVEANQLSVRQELQADCYAGVWAHHAQSQRSILEEGDIDEGLRAATAIGDDTLQRRAGGRVAPESWTHGSSEQRVRWFRQGWQSGSLEQCDTFNARTL